MTDEEVFKIASGVEGYYHPCTSILIEGLKQLKGGGYVLAKWDRARAKVDTALAARQSVEKQPLPCQECGGDGAGGEHEEDCTMVQPEPDVEALVEALQGLLNIVSDSSGVAGYHLNGNIADWDEFEEVENAEVVISAYHKQGVGNGVQ